MHSRDLQHSIGTCNLGRQLCCYHLYQIGRSQLWGGTDFHARSQQRNDCKLTPKRVLFTNAHLSHIPGKPPGIVMQQLIVNLAKERDRQISIYVRRIQRIPRLFQAIYTTPPIVSTVCGEKNSLSPFYDLDSGSFRIPSASNLLRASSSAHVCILYSCQSMQSLHLRSFQNLVSNVPPYPSNHLSPSNPIPTAVQLRKEHSRCIGLKRKSHNA
jgi:hypothetical protein